MMEAYGKQTEVLLEEIFGDNLPLVEVFTHQGGYADDFIQIDGEWEIVDLQDGFSPNYQNHEMSEVKDTYYQALEVVVAHYAIRRFQDVLERHLMPEG